MYFILNPLTLISKGTKDFFGFGPIVSAGPCEGYDKVGEFDQEINSVDEAKQIALNYYSSIGYDFNFEDFDAAKKSENTWNAWLHFSKLDENKYCSNSANPPECVSPNLRLRNNEILMRYMIAC